MYSKKTLYALAFLLAVEAVVIVAIPSRMPRPARAVTGGVDVLAAVAVILLARLKR